MTLDAVILDKAHRKCARRVVPVLHLRDQPIRRGVREKTGHTESQRQCTAQHTEQTYGLKGSFSQEQRSGPAGPRRTSPSASQGDRRSTAQPSSPFLRYRSRSCSRFGRPSQNSIVSGTKQYPPQNSGTGTLSLFAYIACSSAHFASSGSRLDKTALWR